MLTNQEWRATIGLAGIYATRMFGLFSILPIAALYVDRLPGATMATLGLAIGIYGLVQAVLQWPFGWLSDRYGRRRLIAIGLVLFVVGSVIAALAETVWGVMLGRAVQGAGAMAGVVLALTTELVDEERRSRALAVIGLTIGLTFSLSLLAAPWIDAHLGLSGVFWISAGLGLIALAWLWWLVPDPGPGPAATAAACAPLRAVRAPRLQADEGWAPLVGPMLGALVLHALLAAAFLMIPGAWLTVGVAPSAQGWWYLPVLLAGFALMLLLVVVGERRGWVRGVLRVAVGLLLLTVAFAAVVATVTDWRPGGPVAGLSETAAAAWPALAAFVLGLVVFFVAFNTLEASLPALVAKRVAMQRRGAAMGAFATAQFVGIFVGGAGGGGLLAAQGPVALLWVMVALAALWWLGLWRMAPVARLRTEAFALPGQWVGGVSSDAADCRGAVTSADPGAGAADHGGLLDRLNRLEGVDAAWLAPARQQAERWILWLRYDASRVSREELRAALGVPLPRDPSAHG